jgi:hypothetical protein
LLLVNQGNVTMNSDAGSPGAANLGVGATGAATTVNFNATQHLTSLSVGSGAKVTVGQNGARALVVNSLDTAFTGGGQVDLKDNKLIAQNTAPGTFNGSAYTGVTGAIQSGRNGGNWGGSGIVTSQSNATNGSNYTAIGVATAAQAKGITGTDTASWAGEAVSAGDTLVMYTYGGDANLDGLINIDDYGRIDTHIGLGTTGWYNGDFNYDGKINVDDYGIIDVNVGIQGAPFSTASGSSPLGGVANQAVTAVPEPAAAVSIIAAGAGLLLRRSRRSRLPR